MILLLEYLCCSGHGGVFGSCAHRIDGHSGISALN
jgi:hypothetical protein